MEEGGEEGEGKEEEALERVRGGEVGGKDTKYVIHCQGGHTSFLVFQTPLRFPLGAIFHFKAA